jgi:hypothetical protein
MRFVVMLCALAVPAFSGAKYARYVFSLLDSNFVVKARVESYIQSTRDPDTAEVKIAANSVSRWHYARLNSQPVGDVWLAYEPPSDPGSVMFVSNTMPPYPLLTLYIDAMCGSCFSQYSVFGNVSVPVDAVTDGKNLDIVPLENDFRLGLPLSDEERMKIAEKIDDYALSMPHIHSVTVHVVKWVSDLSTKFPSKDGIRYIAYFSIIEPTASIAEGAVKVGPPDLPRKRFDALGRSPKRLSPFANWEWRAYSSDRN